MLVKIKKIYVNDPRRLKKNSFFLRRTTNHILNNTEKYNSKMQKTSKSKIRCTNASEYESNKFPNGITDTVGMTDIQI